MYLDTSSIVAVMLGEPDAADLYRTIALAEQRITSVGTLMETILAVGHATGDRTSTARQVKQFLKAANVDVVPLTEDCIVHFDHAYRQYHRGSGSSAKFNFGDCLTYAAAKAFGQRILYKGEDFAQTDMA